MKKHLFFLLLVVLCGTTVGQTIEYKDLVKRLTDMKALAVPPVKGEKSAMWASYDRRSKVDNSGKFIDWSANNDGFEPQYIRKEGENMVLAEMEGPGAIVRIWSANPQKGHVKVYIDGNPIPVIDMPFVDFFNPSSILAFNYPELVYETAARGCNNYVPITYQRSCKIVGEPEWGQYYHYNYITFPAGTQVAAFETKPSAGSAHALKEVNDFFASSLGELPYKVENTEEQSFIYTITPGASETINFTGSKVIYALKASLESGDSAKMADLLRNITISINWDNEKSPSVWSPLGDFFGSSPGFNLYRTLPMGMTDKGMYSYWYMPFAQSAKITLSNQSKYPTKLSLSVGLETLEKEKANSYLRFHAKWHRNLAPLNDTTRWPDWTVLETEGTGRFAGMALMVWNPKGGSCKEFAGEGHHWWGEGDEKFFVDNESFPSTFGTGTEDYFGYAWGNPNFFNEPFHSQNHTENNMGNQSLNRWQVIDNVPFQVTFKGYLEKYFPDHWPTNYAVIPYWYLNHGGNDPLKPENLKGD